MDLDLSGKLALVTGSTKGIGYAIAAGLARMGATVIINGRDPESVAQALSKLSEAALGGAFLDGAADLLDDDDLRRLFTSHPKVDVLVNNVGAYSNNSFFDLTDQDWLALYRINVLSGVRVTRHYLKAMLESGWGRVVNIASESGVFVPPEMIHYGASKAAQLAFSRGIAELTVGTGVTVNAVLPGPTLVETVAKQARQRAEREGVDQATFMRNTFEVRRPTSLIKRYTAPEEIASMVCYLCSPASSATNGAPIRVDGGIIRTYA
jgi:NAD(P)-dependent dehydrogenase (short-subunit alcohol dehydrogenase family)